MKMNFGRFIRNIEIDGFIQDVQPILNELSYFNGFNLMNTIDNFLSPSSEPFCFLIVIIFSILLIIQITLILD